MRTEFRFQLNKLDLRICNLSELNVSRQQGKQTWYLLTERPRLHIVQIYRMMHRAKRKYKWVDLVFCDMLVSLSENEAQILRFQV